MKRKITIISSKTQSQKVIQDSAATTLGELKNEMRELGIDYTGMTFYEGHARIELKDDSSVLPTNIPWKGQVVNDLVFMMTTPEKKIKSGSISRAEAYRIIKERGLQEACKIEYGKNFTQCSTASLICLIDNDSEVHKVKKEVPVEKVVTKKGFKEECNCKNCKCCEALKSLLEHLYDEEIIYEHSYDEVLGILRGENPKTKELSKTEIDDMFDFIDK